MLRALKRLDGGHQWVELSKLLGELYKGFVIQSGGELRLKRFPAGDETMEFFLWDGYHGFSLRRASKKRACLDQPPLIGID
jgi:hypothetical protein